MGGVAVRSQTAEDEEREYSGDTEWRMAACSIGKKKLSYLEAREYADIEDRVAAAEDVLQHWRAVLEDPAISTDAVRLQEALAESGKSTGTGGCSLCAMGGVGSEAEIIGWRLQHKKMQPRVEAAFLLRVGVRCWSDTPVVCSPVLDGLLDLFTLASFSLNVFSTSAGSSPSDAKRRPISWSVVRARARALRASGKMAASRKRSSRVMTLS